MKSIEQELIATAVPYWEVEATIVRRFFASKPSREDHVFWLKAQLWKELHPVDGYFTGLQKELNDLARISHDGVQIVQAVQPLRSAQTPSFVLPRDAGEERGRGLNGLNCWNGLNSILNGWRPGLHCVMRFTSSRE